MANPAIQAGETTYDNWMPKGTDAEMWAFHHHYLMSGNLLRAIYSTWVFSQESFFVWRFDLGSEAVIRYNVTFQPFGSGALTRSPPSGDSSSPRAADPQRVMVDLGVADGRPGHGGLAQLLEEVGPNFMGIFGGNSTKRSGKIKDLHFVG